MEVELRIPKVYDFVPKETMKKVAVGSALTPTGAALVASNRFSLAFDEIKNLSLIICELPPFKQDKQAQAYRHLLLKTEIARKKDNSAINVFNTTYSKMLEAYLSRIVEQDLTWLQEDEISMSKKGTEAKLPLSAAYEWCMTNSESKLNDLECTLLLIFKYLQNPESPEGKALDEICSEFKKNEKEEAGKKAVANIVNKVKKNLPGDGSKPPQTSDVIKIVQAIVGGGQEGGDEGDMGTLAQGILSGKVTIPDLVAQVKSAVETKEEDDEEQDGTEAATEERTETPD